MATARLFLALDLAPEVQRRLVGCGRALSPALGDARWVRAEAIHLTLLFLGDTPEERLDDLAATLSATLTGEPPVPCVIQGIGVFPNPLRPLVVWAGLTTGSDALARLAARVQGSLKAAGIASDERPFAAHVTLGRLRPRAARVRPGTLRDALEHWSETRFGDLAGDHVTLYASTLTPAGPHYDALRTWPLAATLPCP